MINIKNITRTTPCYFMRHLACFLIMMLMGSHAIFSLTTHNKTANKERLHLKSGPPPGFKATELMTQHISMITLYKAGDTQPLANIKASFNNKTIALKNVNTILNKLQHIRQRQLLQKALQKPLKINQQYISKKPSAAHTKNTAPYIKVLKPKNVAIIFDSANYQAYLFINPKYFQPRGILTQSLGNSTAGFSYLGINSLRAVKTHTEQTLSLANQNIFALGANRLNITTNLLYIKTQQAEQTYTQFQLNNINFGHLDQNLFYQVGMVQSAFSDILPSINLLGANISTNEGEIGQNQYSSGSPLFVTLPVAATVVIYKQGNKAPLYTAQLPVGRNQIDTSSSTFPAGSYNLTIVSTDNYGRKTTTHQFFIKQPGVPPKGKSFFQFSAGVIQKYDSQILNDISDTRWISIPHYTKQLVLSYSAIKGLTYDTAFSYHLLSIQHDLYADAGLEYHYNSFSLSPTLLVSTNKYYGLALRAGFSQNNWSTNFHITRFFSPSETPSLTEKLNSENRIIQYNKLELDGSIHYNIFGVGVNLDLSKYIDRQNQATSVQTLTLDKLFSMNNNGDLSISFSLTRTNKDKQLSLTFDYSFFSPDENGLAADVSVGYDHGTADDNNGSGLANAFSISKYHDFGPNTHGNFSGSYKLSSDKSRTFQGQIDYQSPAVRMSLFATHNAFTNSTEDTTTQYTAQLDNSSVYTNQKWGFGYSNDIKSGVEVYVKSAKPTKVKVIIDDGGTQIINANRATPVFMQPYYSHEVSIVPVGNNFYYDANPKIVNLYDGNFQLLTWSLHQQYVLFTKIVNEKGTPLVHAYVDDKGGEFNDTDAHGYVQLNLLTGIKKLQLKSLNGKSCHIIIPAHLDTHRGFVTLKKITCFA